MKKRILSKFEITCKTCKKVFYVNNFRKNTAKFCSKYCHSNRSKRFLNCKKCGNNFCKTEWKIKNNKYNYCSRECYDNREDEIMVLCDGCKKEIKIFPSQKRYYNNHYCSNGCRIKFGHNMKMLNSDNVNSKYQRFIRSVRHCADYYDWRNDVWDKYNKKCYKCGKKDNLTVHHKNTTMYDFFVKYGFDKKSIYEDHDFFNVDNGELLCRRCHAKEYLSNY